MLKSILKNYVIALLTLVMILMLVIGFMVIINRSVIDRNAIIKNQVESVKKEFTYHVDQTIRHIDVGLRGYALMNDKNFLYKSYAELRKDHDRNTFKLDSLLKIQGYTDIEGLKGIQELRAFMEDYFIYFNDMVAALDKGDTTNFKRLFLLDKGNRLGVVSSQTKKLLFTFEDELYQQAESTLEAAANRNLYLQLTMIFIGIPSIILVIRNLKQEQLHGKGVLIKLQDTNRKYLFNSGNEQQLDSIEMAVNESVLNMQQASDFLSQLSRGNYSSTWKGMREENQNLNKENLAGRVVALQNDLECTKQEEEKRKWTSEGLTKFSELVRNHQKSVQDLSLECIRFLSKYLHAQQGSLFVLNEEESEPYLKLSACFAFDKKKYIEKRIAIGDGLVGQAFLEGGTVMMTQVPQGYLHITSGLGHANPTCLVIVPMKYNDKTEAVIELASFVKPEAHQINFLERCGEFIASALQSVKNYEITNRLLQESQQQAEELKSQEEEMRQNLEEMEATQEASRRLEIETQSYLSALNVINESTASIEFSPEGEIIKANKIFLELMGYTQEEIKGKHHRIFVPEAFVSSEEYKKQWSDLREGVSIKGVFARIDKNGNTIWLNGTYAPMRDQQGQVIKVIKLAQDVTESKKSEQSFERLSLVANNTDNSVIITSKLGLIEYVNLGFTRMTGYSAEEVIGKKPGQILQGQDTDKATIKTIRDNLNAQQPFYAEIMNYHKNGESYWISLAINPVFDSEGQLDKYIAIQSNVTETKLKALDFSSKLTAIDKSYGVVEFDTLGTILDVNENFLDVVGYGRDEVIGQHHRLFVGSQEKESKEYKEFWNKLGVEGKFVSGEFERVAKSGERVWLKGSYNAIVDLNGKPYKVVKYVQDITRQRKLESEMEQQQLLLKGVSKAIDLTLATIEFDSKGNILTANENFLQLMDYSLSDIAGMHHRIFVQHEFAASKEYLDFWKKLNQRNPQIGEVKRITRAGDTVWLNASYTPVMNAAGEVIKVIKFAQDITEQKIKTLEFEGQANAIDNTMASIEFSTEGIIVNANHKFLNTMGYSLEEIQGKHHRIFVDRIYAQSTEYIQFWLALAGGHSQSGEFQRIGNNKKDIWLSASYTPVRDTLGKVYKVIKFAQDITDQKIKTLDFEGQIRAIDNTMASIELSVEGLIINANQKFLDKMGYFLEEIKGKHHRIFVSDSYAESMEYTRFWKELALGFSQSGEFQRIGKNRKEVWLNASYTPVKDASGKVYKVIKFIMSVKKESTMNAL